MNIRAFIEEDLPHVFDIYSLSKLDELRFEERSYSLLPLDQDTKHLSELLKSDIYIYQICGEICGYGALHENEIRALFVRPTHRGKGIGKSLFEWLLSHIPGEACLYVASSNYPAKNMYENYGFKVTNTFETTYNQQAVFAQKMVRPK